MARSEKQHGEITGATDFGERWQVLFHDRCGEERTLYFNRDVFPEFYEGATGRNFRRDYRQGAATVTGHLIGQPIDIE